jgi:hypothetical protein
MYRVCVAVALCAALTAAVSAWANLADTTPIFAKPTGAPRPRDNAIRLAQQDNQSVSTGNPSVAPLKWVGMLINPTPTKKDPNLVSECTGQFIRPNVVITAGHCIKDLPDNPTGPWFDLSKQVFILQYQNGEGSQTFKTVCALTSPLWTLPANFSSMNDDQQGVALRAASEHDFAMVLVNGTSPTGTMPYALDWKGKVDGAVRVGYAVDILDGEVIQQADGIVFFANQIPMFPEAPPDLVVHWQSITDLTSGTSGGAWIANFSTTEGPNNNFLIAVTSFKNDNYPGAILAAYLTAAEFNPLLASVSNGCR